MRYVALPLVCGFYQLTLGRLGCTHLNCIKRMSDDKLRPPVFTVNLFLDGFDVPAHPEAIPAANPIYGLCFFDPSPTTPGTSATSGGSAAITSSASVLDIPTPRPF